VRDVVPVDPARGIFLGFLRYHAPQFGRTLIKQAARR